MLMAEEFINNTNTTEKCDRSEDVFNPFFGRGVIGQLPQRHLFFFLFDREFPT